MATDRGSPSMLGGLAATQGPARYPAAPAPVCHRCGEGSNEKGCLVAVRWSTEVHGWVWAHRACERPQP
jgi:hypothetical protein